MPSEPIRYMVGALLLVAFAGVGDALHAQRACHDNFSESGEWASGKSFTTFVEATGTTYDEAFRTAAQAVAREGFLGLTTDKDIGVIAAYQEDNGKKSTITVVVSEVAAGSVRAEATFSLARGLRSPSAAVRDYLCKMLEPIIPPEQRSSDTASSGIVLMDGNEEVSLTLTVGEFRKAGFGPVLLLFFDFEDARAEARTQYRRPSVLVRSEADPKQDYVWVRCESDGKDDKRSIKVGSAGSLIKAGVTGDGEMAPDPDWTLPFTSELQQEGIWRLTPTVDLEPGEYGIWDVKGYGVALFGLD